MNFLFAAFLASGLISCHPGGYQHPFTATPKDCSNFQGMDSCKGQQVDYPEVYETRRWQASPHSNSISWQHYRNLQGYAQVTYNSNRDEATVEVITFTRVKPIGPILYQFGNAAWQESPKMTVNPTGNEQGLSVKVWAPSLKNSTLNLDPLYFVWQNQAVEAPHTQQGQKGAIVELFGWPYKDVAKECETFLGKAGYMGVKYV
jgi:alpha-amylase